MEYRIHLQNGIKLSIIGVNFTDWQSNKKNFDTSNLKALLLEASKNDINFISVSESNSNVISDILEWEKSNNSEFYISYLIGDIIANGFMKNRLKTKNEIFSNRFTNLYDRVKMFLSKTGLKQIHFLSLYFVKSSHLKEYDFNSISKRLKNEGLITSFGLYCQFLSDAIQLANLLELDHLEIEIDINSSPEMVNSILKIAKKRSISVICHQKESISFQKDNNITLNDPLENLLIQGEESFKFNINKNFDNKDEYFFDISLRKNLIGPYQAICLKLKSINVLKIALMSLNKPFLDQNEIELIQNSINPTIYDSPKHSKNIP